MQLSANYRQGPGVQSAIYAGQRTRPGDRRLTFILGEAEQPAGRPGRSRGGIMQRLGESLMAFRFMPVPLLNLLRRPSRRAVRVTLITGIRRSQFDGQIRPRYPEAVIFEILQCLFMMGIWSNNKGFRLMHAI